MSRVSWRILCLAVLLGAWTWAASGAAEPEKKADAKLRLNLRTRVETFKGSGVWDEVYREYLNHRPLVTLATPLAFSPRSGEKAA